MNKDDIGLFFKKNKAGNIDISVIDKKNAKVFNIKNLKYSEPQLIDFRQNGEFGKYFAFTIGQGINNQLVLSEKITRSPLLVSELVFSE